MSSRQWVYGIVLALTVATGAHATTFFVDAGQGNNTNTGLSAADPFLTIQWALNAAAALPGADLIQIAAGEYHENLAISDADAVTLSGADGVFVVAGNPLKDVIKITWGDVSMSSLTITGGSKAIVPTGSAGKPVSLSLRDVIITANTSDAVRATNVGEIRAAQCTFYANGGTGLRIQTADSVTASHCAFEDNAGRGMRTEDVGSTTVSHCQFLNNHDDGIKAVTVALDRTQADLSISDTAFAASYDDGIDLELLGDIRLTNVTVEGTITDDGVSIDDSVSVAVIGGTYANNATDGLDMDDVQSIRMVNVTVTDNGDSGFDVTAEGGCNVESVSIVASEFSDNGLDGIWMGEAGTIMEQVSLTSVTANNNGESGWDIHVTGTVKLAAVTAEGNGQPHVP